MTDTNGLQAQLDGLLREMRSVVDRVTRVIYEQRLDASVWLNIHPTLAFLFGMLSVLLPEAEGIDAAVP